MSYQGGSSGGSGKTILRHGDPGPRRAAAPTPPKRQAPSGPAAVEPRAQKSGGKGWRADAKREPDPILFQTYFKSVGPRTYAAQMKRANNGNQYLVFTEGKRDKVTDEVRKISLYVYSEDFVSFFKMLKQTAEFVKAHPLPAEFAAKRSRYWQKQNAPGKPGARP